MYKFTPSLDFGDFPRKVLMALGASKSAVDKWEPAAHGHITNPSSPDDNKNIGEILFRRQLLPGNELDTLQKALLGNLHEALKWDNISSKAILSMTQDTKRISLHKWCLQVLLDSATRAFFGDQLLEIEPDLCHIFRDFDDNSWQLHYKYPRFLSKKLHTARDKIVNALKLYFQLPEGQRQGGAWVIRSFEVEMKRRKIAVADIAAILLGVFWVYVTNFNDSKQERPDR